MSCAPILLQVYVYDTDSKTIILVARWGHLSLFLSRSVFMVEWIRGNPINLKNQGHDDCMVLKWSIRKLLAHLGFPSQSGFRRLITPRPVGSWVDTFTYFWVLGDDSCNGSPLPSFVFHGTWNHSGGSNFRQSAACFGPKKLGEAAEVTSVNSTDSVPQWPTARPKSWGNRTVGGRNCLNGQELSRFVGMTLVFFLRGFFGSWKS